MSLKRKDFLNLLIIILFYLSYIILVRIGLSQIPRYILGFVFAFILFYFFRNEIKNKIKFEFPLIKENIWLGIKLIFGVYFTGFILTMIVLYFFGNNEDYTHLVYVGSKFTIFTIVSNILIFPIIEEIFYRFIVFDYLKTKIKYNFLIILIISFFFAIGHLNNQIRLFLWSLFVTYIYSKTEKLITVIIFHIFTVAISYVLMYYFVEVNI
ncbi:MAG: CPBP family intramembrane metalloprotease [Candidatus Muirbacterium halophilum]|nr:CPBP family intramembrane metalloprotease [Candidatus Muirbacterium halophilum]MCK9475210.1 CPBP family intramembrane metalloprotease [Candidatus Muirbacterium halophilum]